VRAQYERCAALQGLRRARTGCSLPFALFKAFLRLWDAHAPQACARRLACRATLHIGEITCPKKEQGREPGELYGEWGRGSAFGGPRRGERDGRTCELSCDRNTAPADRGKGHGTPQESGGVALGRRLGVAILVPPAWSVQGGGLRGDESRRERAFAQGRG